MQDSQLHNLVPGVRGQLLAAVEAARHGHGPLASAGRAELSRSSSANVVKKLRDGDVLGAANSAFASAVFTQAVNTVLQDIVAPVVEVLEQELRPVLWGERRLRARVPRDRTSHLPLRCVRQGFIPEEETRDLIAFALSDALLVSQWVLRQEVAAQSAAAGFVAYAAGASNFVNRTGLFGARVRVDTTDAQVPVYDYESGLHLSLGAEEEGRPAAEDEVAVHAFAADQHSADALEALLLDLMTAHLKRAPGQGFAPLFEALCERPLLDLREEGALLRRSAARVQVPVAEMQVTAAALMEVVTNLRLQQSTRPV